MVRFPVIAAFSFLLFGSSLQAEPCRDPAAVPPIPSSVQTSLQQLAARIERDPLAPPSVLDGYYLVKLRQGSGAIEGRFARFESEMPAPLETLRLLSQLHEKFLLGGHLPEPRDVERLGQPGRLLLISMIGQDLREGTTLISPARRDELLARLNFSRVGETDQFILIRDFQSGHVFGAASSSVFDTDTINAIEASRKMRLVMNGPGNAPTGPLSIFSPNTIGWVKSQIAANSPSEPPVELSFSQSSIQRWTEVVSAKRSAIQFDLPRGEAWNLQIEQGPPAQGLRLPGSAEPAETPFPTASPREMTRVEAAKIAYGYMGPKVDSALGVSTKFGERTGSPDGGIPLVGEASLSPSTGGVAVQYRVNDGGRLGVESSAKLKSVNADFTGANDLFRPATELSGCGNVKLSTETGVSSKVCFERSEVAEGSYQRRVRIETGGLGARSGSDKIDIRLGGELIYQEQAGGGPFNPRSAEYKGPAVSLQTTGNLASRSSAPVEGYANIRVELPGPVPTDRRMTFGTGAKSCQKMSCVETSVSRDLSIGDGMEPSGIRPPSTSLNVLYRATFW